MNPGVYIPIIVLWIILFISLSNRRAVIARQIMKKTEEDMKVLAKKFVDKECLISSFDSNHQFEGIIREVSDSAILVERNGDMEAINLNFVIRIREYPRNKKGKKKSVVLD